MKKLLLILLTASGLIAGAQTKKVTDIPKWGEDSVKCRENLYIYYELAKGKNYIEAYDGWKYVIDNCPASSKNNVIFGPYIVEAKLKAATTDAEKEEFMKMLMRVYNVRMALYPEDSAYVLERKALDMIQHWPDSAQRALALFKKGLELDKEHSAAFYNGYFIDAARLFNDDVFEISDVFRTYNEVIEGVEYNTDALNRSITSYKASEEHGTITEKEKEELAKAERELGRYDDVTSNIEKILGPIATCEKLQSIYNAESFEANKGDATWLRRAAKMLSKERTTDEGEETDCTDNPIFFKVAEALYKLEPSPTAARAVANMAYKKNNYSKAIQLYNEAASQEVDPKKQAVDYMRIATANLKMGRLADAKSAAVKAAGKRKNWGAPYLLLAQIYAAADGQCGSNVFEKKAVYWAAIDKLKYAKSIDPSVASRANKLISAYKQQLPDKSVIFQLGITEGNKHTIQCFVGETITVDYNI